MKPFKIISFDCYGTLIDWEMGIIDALQPWLLSHGVTLTNDAVLQAYARLEPAAEAGPYKRYREVLEWVAKSFATEHGFTLGIGEEGVLHESLGRWPAFADSASTLTELRNHYQVAILSNVDNDLIRETLRNQGLQVDLVFTAEDARAYKPSPLFFGQAIHRLSVSPSEILHCGCSKYHDLAPASALGISTAWINRRHGMEGSGATPELEMEPNETFSSLGELRDWLLK